MRLVWVTDPHLNHVSAKARDAWIQQVASHGPDGVVICGDISEGDDVVLQLNAISRQIAAPIYFVLGNHDFYGSSIAQTRQNVIRASRAQPGLRYLTDCPAIEIGGGCFVVGEDGWGDATEGDYEESYVHLNDFRLIKDFVRFPPNHWKQQLEQLGKESADRLEAKLSELPSDTREVLVVTHVPPYRQACWYQGRTTDENWAPFFVCGQLGQKVIQAAQSRPDCQFTILCGHTHHAGVAAISVNLVVYTGAAEYGKPEIEGLIDISDHQLKVSVLR